MSLQEYLRREDVIRACPPGAACSAVLQGALAARLWPRFELPPGICAGKPHVPVAIFGEGDVVHTFAVHHLNNVHKSPRSYISTSTKVVLDTLLLMTGFMYWIDAPGYPPTLLIIPSSDLISALFSSGNGHSHTMNIPLPVRDTSHFRYSLYVDAWGAVPR